MELARRGMLTSKGSALKPMEFALVVGLAAIFGVLWFGQASGAGFCRAGVADNVLSILFFCVAQWTWGPAMQQVRKWEDGRMGGSVISSGFPGFLGFLCTVATPSLSLIHSQAL